MWEARAEIQTRAAPEAVWRLWENPARWKDWNDQITDAELEGPLVVGATARIRFRRSPGSLRFKITALEPGRLLTDETRFPGARLGHEHLVERDGDATRISHRLYFDGPAGRLYALLMGRQMRRAVRDFVGHERRLAEAAKAQV